jgi:secreted trypsin-like serine protease
LITETLEIFDIFITGPVEVTLDGSKCTHRIVGITNFGGVCGREKGGVYAKVSAYLDWIEDIVWPED